MRHDAQFMQTRLPVEKDNVPVLHVPVYHVARVEVPRDIVPVPVLEGYLVLATVLGVLLCYVVRTWVLGGTVDNAPSAIEERKAASERWLGCANMR